MNRDITQSENFGGAGTGLKQVVAILEELHEVPGLVVGGLFERITMFFTQVDC